MSPNKCRVEILEGERLCTYSLRKGARLDALAAKETIPVEFDCRKADCGICIVWVRKGRENLSDPDEKERDYLKAMRADENERLGCQCRIRGDVTLEVEVFDEPVV